MDPVANQKCTYILKFNLHFNFIISILWYGLAVPNDLFAFM